MSTTTSRLLPAALAPFEWSPLSWLQLAPNMVRVEESLDGQAYTLRAEVPGIDPVKDLTVTYHDGSLRVQIRREDVRKDRAHSEFHYGLYGRTVALPAGVDERSIHAAYRDGILEITAKVVDEEETFRKIPVTVERPAVKH
jgi:HSP20 family protein